MASIEVKFSGEPIEVLEAMRLFLMGVNTGGAVTPAPVGSSAWSEEELIGLWGDLKDGAQEVLVSIAENNGKVSNTDLQLALGLDSGFKLAGRMSSYGFAIKRLGLTEKEPIYMYDYVNGIYSMKPEICEMIQKIVGHLED